MTLTAYVLAIPLLIYLCRLLSFERALQMRGRALPVWNFGVINNFGKKRAVCLLALVRGLTQG